MSILYICEKPSQARDIARALGVASRQDGYIEGKGIIVTWCLGHLLELAPPDDYCKNLKPWRMEVLPVIPKEWHMIPQKRTKAQFNIIKKLLKSAAEVVIATDADREGDVIGREVIEFCGYSGKVKRLWLSALDDASIKKALSNIQPGDKTFPLYQAGLGRQRADWLIGMNMTMATSHLFGRPGQGVLSVGRVQTPTLGLIVNRDREIEDFKPKDYFELRVEFSSNKGRFWAKWQPNEECSDDAGRCLKLEHANVVAELIEGKQGNISSFEDKKKKTPPPTAFSLSSLQKLCSSKYGYRAKQTLQIAQSLYEKHKATTYPRTDSGYLPTEQLSEVSGVLSAIVRVDNSMAKLVDLCDKTLVSPTWNDKKVTAHHGIIPTMNQGVSLKSMSDEELKVYDLIRRYYMAQFLGDYHYTSRKLSVLCVEEAFNASCNIPSQLGWKQAIGSSQEEIEGDETQENVLLPCLTKGDGVTHASHSVESKQTKPPSRFTEGSLITAMKNVAKYIDDPALKRTLRETSGIGTEATRADIIEKLITREFIDRKKKQLISTERGRALIDIVPDKIKNPGTTAVWEQTLDDIASREASLSDFLLDQEDILDFMLEDIADKREAQGNSVHNKFIKGDTHPCPLCQAPMLRRKGKKGFWWGCTAYPECKETCRDNKGRPSINHSKEKV